jgi:putative transposase
MNVDLPRLRQFISYKSDNHGRKCVLVDPKYTTMTCSNCWSRTGPTGLDGLVVRSWKCNFCGTQHDRDVNSAKVILNSGLGCSLDNAGTLTYYESEISRLESSGGAR